jgi:hypothetical protein
MSLLIAVRSRSTRENAAEEHHDMLGGSASYASVAASFHTSIWWVLSAPIFHAVHGLVQARRESRRLQIADGRPSAGTARTSRTSMKRSRSKSI